MRLATGFSLGDAGVISEALQDVIRKNQTLAQLVNALRARGTMKIKAFKAEVIVLAGLKAKSRGLAFIKTILDLLQDAQLISVTDDTVALFRGLRIDETQQIETSEVALESRPASPAKPSVQPLGHRGIHMPLPLGPNRLAYIDLPEDWKKGELPKLIKLLQLSLGDEGETESE